MWKWKTPAKPTLPRLLAWVAWAGVVMALVFTREVRDGLSIWWNADKPKLPVLVGASWWWGGVGLAVLGLALLLTSRWWARPWSAVSPVALPKPPRWLWPVVLALMLAGTAIRLPRLGLSLYNDESHAFRAHIAGEVPKAYWGNPDKYRPVTWLSTLYENRAGNNSMPFSILTRLSYDTWRAKTGAPSGRVNEPALRLPVLVCAVLSIGAMAWLGLRLGGPGLALLTALLTTFHPWHMRYSVEARGYGMLMLALPLAFIAFDAALRSGKWRAWVVFALMQYAVLTCWFGASHLLLALHLSLAAYAVEPALRGKWQKNAALKIRWNLLVPSVVSGVIALGLYLQLNLAQFVQLSKALADPSFFKSPHPFPLEWFQDVGGFLGFGIPGLWFDSGPGVQPTVASLMGSGWSVAVGAGVLLWLAGLLRGGARLVRGVPTGFAVIGGTFGGALLTYAYCTSKGILFLKWYALFLIPGLILLLAAGLQRLGKGRLWAGLLLTLPFLAAWMPGLTFYAHHGRENLRAAVETARGVPYPDSLTNPHDTLYAITWSESPVYDPDAVTLKNGAMLRKLMAQAARDNRKLFVAFGHSAEAHQYAADVLSMVDDPARFRQIARLPGLDDIGYDHYVYQLIPGEEITPTPEAGEASGE